jgi:spermidine synthase
VEHFTEFLYAGHGQVFTVDEVIFRERGAEQDILVFRNQRYGRIMALEGAVQVTEQDEFIYHEVMAHVPLFAHGAAADVLIIGGGDGGTLRHVLMHKTVQRAVMVEIEPGVIELSKQYFPKICGQAFADPRTELIIGDGCAYVQETAARFDVIIVDATDPIGPGKVLYTPEFYAACKRCLKPGGVLRTHTGMATEHNTALGETVQALRQSFAQVEFSLATIPTYIPGCMVFSLSSDAAAVVTVSAPELTARLQTSGIACRYYTPAWHKGSSALPQFVCDLVGAV